MLPMVVGMMVASMGSGKLITSLGKYRIYPILGTLIMAIGLWLFSHLGLTTSYVTLSLWMIVIGQIKKRPKRSEEPIRLKICQDPQV